MPETSRHFSSRAVTPEALNSFKAAMASSSNAGSTTQAFIMLLAIASMISTRWLSSAPGFLSVDSLMADNARIMDLYRADCEHGATSTSSPVPGMTNGTALDFLTSGRALMSSSEARLFCTTASTVGCSGTTTSSVSVWATASSVFSTALSSTTCTLL